MQVWLTPQTWEEEVLGVLWTDKNHYLDHLGMNVQSDLGICREFVPGHCEDTETIIPVGLCPIWPPDATMNVLWLCPEMFRRPTEAMHPQRCQNSTSVFCWNRKCPFDTFRGGSQVQGLRKAWRCNWRTHPIVSGSSGLALDMDNEPVDHEGDLYSLTNTMLYYWRSLNTVLVEPNISGAYIEITSTVLSFQTCKFRFLDRNGIFWLTWHCQYSPLFILFVAVVVVPCPLRPGSYCFLV